MKINATIWHLRLVRRAYGGRTPGNLCWYFWALVLAIAWIPLAMSFRTGWFLCVRIHKLLLWPFEGLGLRLSEGLVSDAGLKSKSKTREQDAWETSSCFLWFLLVELFLWGCLAWSILRQDLGQIVIFGIFALIWGAIPVFVAGMGLGWWHRPRAGVLAALMDVPGLTLAYVWAKKNKVCPLIEVVGEPTTPPPSEHVNCRCQPPEPTPIKWPLGFTEEPRPLGGDPQRWRVYGPAEIEALCDRLCTACSRPLRLTEWRIDLGVLGQYNYCPDLYMKGTCACGLEVVDRLPI